MKCIKLRGWGWHDLLRIEIIGGCMEEPMYVVEILTTINNLSYLLKVLNHHIQALILWQKESHALGKLDGFPKSNITQN